jgi:hypothetical protein
MCKVQAESDNQWIALWIANTPCLQALPAHEIEFLRKTVRKNSPSELPHSFT